MKTHDLSRRDFLQRSIALAAGAPLALKFGQLGLTAAESTASSTARGSVAIVPCKTYGPEVQPALNKCFDLLGGIGSLVKNKTVTVKLNLTGTDFRPFLTNPETGKPRPVGETYMTHYATVFALTSSLFAAGAKRVRFVAHVPVVVRHNMELVKGALANRGNEPFPNS